MIDVQAGSTKLLMIVEVSGDHHRVCGKNCCIITQVEHANHSSFSVCCQMPHHFHSICFHSTDWQTARQKASKEASKEASGVEFFGRLDLWWGCQSGDGHFGCRRCSGGAASLFQPSRLSGVEALSSIRSLHKGIWSYRHGIVVAFRSAHGWALECLVSELKLWIVVGCESKDWGFDCCVGVCIDSSASLNWGVAVDF